MLLSDLLLTPLNFLFTELWVDTSFIIHMQEGLSFSRGLSIILIIKIPTDDIDSPLVNTWESVAQDQQPQATSPPIRVRAVTGT